jgi:hypothetical protein
MLLSIYYIFYYHRHMFCLYVIVILFLSFVSLHRF